MSKLRWRHWPQYLLALLLLLLIVLMGWTYYLGKPAVTFERLVGSAPYAQIEDLSLRRYKKGAISPHLFTIRTHDAQAVTDRIVQDCGMQKVAPEALPKVLDEVDKEMVAVIGHSPFVYQSTKYDLSHPDKGRLCVLFADKRDLYLFINGNLEGQ